jgi:alpha-L-arabinofuranosidase
VNTSKQPQSVSINLQGMKGERTANVLELWTNGRMEDENTLDKPEKIHPVRLTVPCTEDKKQTVLNDKLNAMSFRLYRIKR